MPTLLAVALLAYGAAATMQLANTIPTVCGRLGLFSLWAIVTVYPWSLWLGPLATEWGLMLIAMMTPLVSMHVASIAWSSRPTRRGVAVGSFLAAYWATWFAAIVVLVPMGIVLASAVGRVADTPAAIAFAACYSASPVAQRARNLCHRTGPVPAFGLAILMGSGKRGMMVGAYCIAACWPWMLVPMTVEAGHLPAMMLVGVYLFAERLAPPAPSRWRLPPAFTTIFGEVSRPIGTQLLHR